MKTKTNLLLFLFLVTVSLLHAETITIDMIVYSLDENNHTAQVVNAQRGLGLRGRESAITDANIRSSITYRGTSYRVTSVRDGAFEDCRSLTTASIPSSVQIIEEAAFRRCYALTSVTISAKEIANNAFGGCINLQSITLNEGVVKIGDGALEGKYTSITIPNSVIKIGKRAFASTQLQSVKFGRGIKRIERSAFANTALREVVIPQNVTSIGESAFYGCKKLTKVIIHNRVKEIEDAAFSDCTNLQTFDLASDNSDFTVVDGVLFNKDQTVLIQYPSGKKNASYTIPNSVKRIAAFAFENVPSLHSVQISNSIMEIGNGNFCECQNLETIRIGNNVKKIGSLVCHRCTSLANFAIPNSVEDIGDRAFQYCGELTEIVLPGSVQFVGNDAFSDCRFLSIKVPTHTEFHRHAFNGIEELTFYDTTNPIEERKKAEAEQKRRQYEAEQKRQRDIQAKKEQEEREKRLKEEAEARKKRAEQERKERERQTAYNKWHKLYLDSINAGYVRGQECVDLGLSVVWATCNIGAKKPQKKGKEMYASEIKKNMNVQKGWRLPSTSEFQELFAKCTVEPVGGFLHYKYIKLVSKINGNSIIIPNAFGVVSDGVCIRLWASGGNSFIWKQRECGQQGGLPIYKHAYESEGHAGSNAWGYLRCVIDK